MLMMTEHSEVWHSLPSRVVAGPSQATLFISSQTASTASYFIVMSNTKL